MLALCLIVVLGTSASAAAETSDNPVWPDRRRDQFQKSFGYALFPYPYSLPGIGQGIGLVGGAMNIADTYTDAYGIIFGGDIKGTSLGVADIHLIPKTLIFDTGFGMVSAATIRSYSQRGMNTEKHDYRLLELGDMEYYGARMTATFFDRRFEVYGAIYSGGGKLKSIRDQDGNVIIESQDPHRSTGHTTLIGTRLDLTDDYTDPRKGIRFDVTRTQSSAANMEPNYYIMDYNTTAYVPLGRRSTWALNFLRSDAIVTRQGETDPIKLQEQQGIDCSTLTDPTLCNEVFNNMAASNKYGTATQLGGFSRLRSYPQGRFKGAHTLFYGTEVRWNLTDERTPYNIFIMKDVRTAVQVAAFYESGSTADLRSELGDIWRDSYGFGLRVVTASGIVFRGDMAFGKEGFEPEIFIGYPWEL
jgi:hypothetical protein